jgi:hypothetical protein
MPITVVARCEAWTVFARSNTGIVGSNPFQGMDMYVYSVFCVVLCIGSGLEMGWSLVQESYRLHNNDYETEEEARAQHGPVEPLMNEWMNEWTPKKSQILCEVLLLTYTVLYIFGLELNTAWMN